MDRIQEKRKEISNVIESYRICRVNISHQEKQIYNIVSTSGLTWKERSDKWGKIHLGMDRLRIDLDYPVGLFNEAELKDLTLLPLKREMVQSKYQSHINPTVGGDKYDTLRIILYSDKLANYDFQSTKFKELLQKIVDSNIL